MVYEIKNGNCINVNHSARKRKKDRLQLGGNRMMISTRRSGKHCLFFLLLGCILTVAGGRVAAAEPVLPAELNYVNIALQDIFRDLAAAGGFRVLFAHPLQERATMIIAPGSPAKKISAEIAANHGLTLKWLDANTAVIGDENSLAGINTTATSRVFCGLFPVAMAEIGDRPSQP